MFEAVVEVPSGDGDIAALIKRPDGDGPCPVVVMFHDGPGVRDATHEVARRIAAAGYFVLVPDRYHRAGRFVHVDPAKLMAAGADSADAKQFRQLLRGTTDEMVGRDLDAVLAYLATRSDARDAPMGTIGFCIGARSVVRALAAHPEVFDAGVGLHPSFCESNEPDSPHLSVPGFTAGMYVGIGAEDTMQSVAMHQRFLDAVAALPDGAYDILAGADHGFAVPGNQHHPEAADHAYERTFALFARRLG